MDKEVETETKDDVLERILSLTHNKPKDDSEPEDDEPKKQEEKKEEPGYHDKSNESP